MKKPTSAIQVVHPIDAAVPIEILATSIVAIADAVKRLNATRLTRTALVVLLVDVTQLSKRDVKKVLDALDVLESVYLKPSTSKKS